jgi:hypothetical protein
MLRKLNRRCRNNLSGIDCELSLRDDDLITDYTSSKVKGAGISCRVFHGLRRAV